jgi:hypothetical protein
MILYKGTGARKVFQEQQRIDNLELKLKKPIRLCLYKERYESEHQVACLAAGNPKSRTKLRKLNTSNATVYAPQCSAQEH